MLKQHKVEMPALHSKEFSVRWRLFTALLNGLVVFWLLSTTSVGIQCVIKSIRIIKQVIHA
jgi:hypothetical protein